MSSSIYKKAFLSAIMLCACLSNEAASDSAVEVNNTGESTTFWLGGDLSSITEWESRGIVTYNAEGEVVETTRLMRDLGLNAVRLRVWVNPKDGFCAPDDMLKLALRAKDLGMAIMIDFHYSDWWADPGHQNVPAAWANYSYEQMCEALADHTRTTLQLLRDNDVDVAWVQIGNETTNGFLWPMAKLEYGKGENMGIYAGLTKAGYEASKSVYPEATVIVHLDSGYDRQLYYDMFDALRAEGCPFDMIGMSVYPFWSKRDQLELSAVTDIVDNINAISERYSVPVMIVETGVHLDTPDQGLTFLTRLIYAAATATNGRCPGVFYWAPECCHGGYRLGAFENDRPTVVMDAFKHFKQ